MLISATKLSSIPILSLHLAGRIALIDRAIVSPHDLSVAAYHLKDIVGSDNDLLLPRDIREFAPIGIIVDSADIFTARGEVVKLDAILDLNFNLVGLPVYTKRNERLGRITDFTINVDSNSVHQLVVSRPLIKSFFEPTLVIHRSQVVKTQDDRVIVNDNVKTVPAEPEFIPNFVNPFRQASLAPAPNQNPDASNTD